MSEDRIEGGLNQAKGSLKDVAGKVLGDDKLEAGGAADKAIGKVQDNYGQVMEQARKTADDIADYAKAKPWMALAAALGVGLLIGHANGRSKRRIVYVRKVKSDEVA